MPNTAHEGNATEVRVAVGVIRDAAGRVLIARRPSHKHQGDLWEFPGGKIEAGESCEAALERELLEELGITVLQSAPLIGVPFSYADKKVFLDVREVLSFAGEAEGREGQPLRWVTAAELSNYKFPAANVPIVKAVSLPSIICISGEFADHSDLISRIKGVAANGAGAIVFRPLGHWEHGVAGALQVAQEMCRQEGILLLVHSSIDSGLWGYGNGVHFRAEHLLGLEDRPVGPEKLFGASCHNLVEIERAKAAGVDFIFLSPVLPTISHLGAISLGWEGFAELAAAGGDVPIYALGGLSSEHLLQARLAGARGIAGISAFWK